MAFAGLAATRRGWRTARIAPGAFHCYLELHIEQGGNLEKAGIPIGVVEGIVSIDEYDVEIRGFANHAGTTPMPERRNALLAAARLIEAVQEIVTREPGRQVGTVGRLEVSPERAQRRARPGEALGRTARPVGREDRAPRQARFRNAPRRSRGRPGPTIAMKQIEHDDAAIATPDSPVGDRGGRRRPGPEDACACRAAPATTRR